MQSCDFDNYKGLFISSKNVSLCTDAIDLAENETYKPGDEVDEEKFLEILM
jgi:hypothetical protein